MPTPAGFSPFFYGAGFLRLIPQAICPRRHKDQQDILSSNHYRLVQVVSGHLELELRGHGSISLEQGRSVLIPAQAVGAVTVAKGFFRHALFDLIAAPRKLNRRGWPVEASMQVQPPAEEAIGQALPLCLDVGGCRAARLAFSRWSVLADQSPQHACERLAVLCTLLAALVPKPDAYASEGLLDLVRRLPPARRSVEAMATAAGCSVRSMQRRVMRTLGVTPQMLINRVRAQEMAECLEHGISLKEIAKRLDFPSTAALTVAFRRRHGMSVRAWRAARGLVLKPR